MPILRTMLQFLCKAEFSFSSARPVPAYKSGSGVGKIVPDACFLQKTLDPISILCAFSNVSSNCLPEKRHLFDFSPLCIKGSGVAKIEPDACFLQKEETLGPISLLLSQMSNVNFGPNTGARRT